MNLFVTGMNPADSNALKRAPRVAIFQAFVEAMKDLKDQGHLLTWRRHKVGDPIPADVDAVVVSLMLPRSLNCPFALGVMWAIHQALEQGIPLVIYLTDWAFFKAHNEFKSIAKAGQDYFSKEIGGSLQYAEDPEAIEEYGRDLLKVCRAYGDPNSILWKRSQVMVPRYTHWGDVSIIQNYLPGANPVHTMDPTPLFLDYLSGGPENWNLDQDLRDQWWILPSLLKDDRWLLKQDLRWPVKRFGPKGFDVLEDERHVHMVYQQSMGALCPPYAHEGSGWWRSRWIHAAVAGTFLLTGLKDARAVGPGYSVRGKTFEYVSRDEQVGMIQQQREELFNKLQLHTEVFRAQLDEVFRSLGLDPEK